jgi:hypothetical protein
MQVRASSPVQCESYESTGDDARPYTLEFPSRDNPKRKIHSAKTAPPPPCYTELSPVWSGLT